MPIILSADTALYQAAWLPEVLLPAEGMNRQYAFTVSKCFGLASIVLWMIYYLIGCAVLRMPLERP